MLSVEEALERILGFFDILEAVERPILDTLGQVLAQDVVSKIRIPPFDNSAMDGYAVQAEGTWGASVDAPVILRVIGSAAAGELPQGTVTPDTAMRIMTGAPIPEGADSIVPFENTDELARSISGQGLSEIGIRAEVSQGADVRPSGQDIRKGQRVLEKGSVVRPPEIGVLASLGLSTVNVIRRPIVAILATGDELLEPGDKYRPGKIYNSNTFSVGAAVQRYGGIPKMLGIAGDNLESVAAKLRTGLDSDILITSAGVSKGDYDMVKDVLAEYGTIDFWSVRMRPAKPLAFGVLNAPDGRKVPHLGLPGNPVSALVAFEQFGRAAICKMLGKTTYRKPTVNAVLDEPIFNPDGRRGYTRVVVTKQDGTYHAKPTGHQGSNLLTSMALANGLAICPDDLPKKDTGEVVEVQMLDWPEEIF